MPVFPMPSSDYLTARLLKYIVLKVEALKIAIKLISSNRHGNLVNFPFDAVRIITRIL